MLKGSRKMLDKFFTEKFLTITNVDGHKIVVKTEHIAYIAEDVKNHIVYIHLSTGKTLTVHLQSMPPLNDWGNTVYNNSTTPQGEK